MTPPLACRLKLSETASAAGVARFTGLECDLDRFAARFTIDGVSGVLASERVLDGVDIDVQSQPNITWWRRACHTYCLGNIILGMILIFI